MLSILQQCRLVVTVATASFYWNHKLLSTITMQAGCLLLQQEFWHFRRLQNQNAVSFHCCQLWLVLGLCFVALSSICLCRNHFRSAG